MQFCKIFPSSLVVLAVVGMLAHPVLAATPQTTHKPLADIAIGQDGQLEGTLLDAKGQARPNVKVVAQQGGNVVATTRSDQTGRFRLGGLKGGLYEFHTDNGAVTYRVWSAGTAPPSAKNQLLIVDTPTVRGQGGYMEACGGFLTHPITIAAIAVTAIALPRALQDDDDRS